ncbi:MAG: hypothetical protein KME60_08340 [Cyanomargarita calcarea GSE-NOS-MK-12-04C]|jgi:hypothetical protein|uniref:Uncharacterized protein n=1 Tax=Cyanomargarita calcarea GSE-NOS-MK-12-04C TaxID=2839659 RepID=A0A951QL39_9CYAN|nr:hypothetical protein [Cyanomargarita calcarea GSE-NOS-MK-12-04C]
MLRKFNALLKGNHLQWTDDAPEISEQPLKVEVTVLEDYSSLEAKSRGLQMAAALEKIASLNVFPELDAATWQREERQERSLPGRDDVD